MIRAAFKRAVAQLEATEKPLSKMVREHLEKDFLATLKVISQFTPKELEATVTNKRDADQFTDAELEDLIASSSADIAGTEEGANELH